MKKISNKAFTLIELMIVVVILGVLMSTVLPKLTGAQARSRDAGRIADIGNIAAALQVYYDDNGLFPGTDKTGYCLGTGTIVTDKLTQYMQSQKVPQDPQPTANKYLCNDVNGNESGLGKYYYAPLEKDGLNGNSYVLCADMETLQKANTIASDIASISVSGTENAVINADTNSDGNESYEDLLSLVGSKVGIDKLSAEPNNDAGESVYCILRP